MIAIVCILGGLLGGCVTSEPVHKTPIRPARPPRPAYANVRYSEMLYSAANGPTQTGIVFDAGEWHTLNLNIQKMWVYIAALESAPVWAENTKEGE